MSTSVSGRLSLLLQMVLWAELAVALVRQHWSVAALSAGAALVAFIPGLAQRQLRLCIPPQFNFAVVAVVFAALFLGEAKGFFEKVWWWDIALHAVTGFLAAVVGLMIAAVICEGERVDRAVMPAFIAVVGFMFAVTAGVAWEIAEFCLDLAFGMNLQKPMLGDPSGLTDTMVDLTVDVIGATAVGLLGYIHLSRRGRPPLVRRSISRFIQNNPRLVNRLRRAR